MFYLSILPFFPAVPGVKADTRAAVFYGSRAGVVTDEQNAAQAVINHMIYNFQQRNYACFSKYGSSTQKENVLYWISWAETNYDCVVAFHHGHGGFRYICNPSIISNGGFENGYSYWTVGGPGDHMVTSEDRYDLPEAHFGFGFYKV
ncbi:MAG: hypothetical protein QXK78_07185 [Candidatus Bathyarchaeia archaeon]